jgi:hypothetical protein
LISENAAEDTNNGITHVGLILVIFSLELDLTNSLLINRPVGKVILRPLGAVSSTFRSAMLESIGREVESGRGVEQWNKCL